jgi:hypothetical protein
MMKTRRFPKLVALLCVTALPLAIACGDDDDDDDDVVTPDASTVDAPPGTPDAAPLDAAVTTRSGLFALTNTKIQVGAGGGTTVAQLGAILINYSAVTSDTSNVLYDDRDALGQGCVVTGYDLDDGEAPADEVDEGEFTFTGDALNLRATGGITCSFNAQAGTFIDPAADPEPDYECVDKVGDATAGSSWAVVSAADPELSAYTIPNDPDTFDLGMAGMSLETTGTTPSNSDVARPIVGLVCAGNPTPPFGTGACVTSDSVLVGGLSGGVVTEGTSKFRVVVGSLGAAAPGQLEILNIADMGDAATTVTINKAAGAVTQAHQTSMTAGGYDNTVDPTVPWDLDDASAKPYSFDIDPASAEATQTFSCDGTGGKCAGQVTVLFGETTTATPDPTDPLDFPAPTTGVQVFYRCAILGTADLVVPAGAMTAIRNTNPTKALSTIVQGNLFQDGDEGNINPLQGITGLAYVGFSSPPASAK